MGFGDQGSVLVQHLVHELPVAGVAERGVELGSAPAVDDVLFVSALAEQVVKVASGGLRDR